ncbi:hypothetical protein GCM10025864_15420 [Luteimicrobium album]|uniref:Major facilitator superfamily (MFS) profile domain-containing protein n=1 Tax=Luteimicrobium album TaxID=1054550 RepID=A0ABQ6I1G7_9MICO|nr:MFS transporter [Luteimicrobium album]GMA23783.1 hypothetical protein GCM10025864_15420 [Luteimicrobium album]
MSALTALVDVRPLKDAPFRRLWLGSTGSQLGTQMTATAVMLQLWDDTGSTAWTGAVGIAHVVPLVVVGLLAGSFADRHDRRRIVLGANLAQLVVSAVLVVQALGGGLPPLALLGLVALQTTAGSAGAPARSRAARLPRARRPAAARRRGRQYTIPIAARTSSSVFSATSLARSLPRRSTSWT